MEKDINLPHIYKIGDIVKTSSGEIGFIRYIFFADENTPYYHITIIEGDLSKETENDLYMEDTLSRLEDYEGRDILNVIALFFKENSWLSSLSKASIIDDVGALVRSAANPTSE